ncbi:MULTISPECIES: PadR family transcriptional regulator [unclassified Knoellia]|uniref:PadR family transcriptional regulator n=1 Tax=Knoellia altitudinis TaxID=3404795 RepID=UPI00360A567F
MPTHDPQMLKGVLGLLLLSALATTDHYGYGLVTQLRSAGFDELAEGTVYPGLTRLESAGFLESYLLRSDSGPARKYYRLTDAGAAELDHRRTSWSDLVQSVATATATTTSTATTTTHQSGDTA